MKRRIQGLLLALLLGGWLLPAELSAQTADSLTVNPFLSNWSLTGSAGVNRLSPTIGSGSGRFSGGYDWVLGKAFSPYGGARLGLQGGRWSMWGPSPRFREMATPGEHDGRTMFRESANFVYLHGDVYLNFSGSGPLSVKPYLHFGVVDSYGAGKHFELEFASGAGLAFDWALSTRLAATLDARAALYPVPFSLDATAGHSVGLSLMGGLTYYPGETGWRNYRTGAALHNRVGDNWFLSLKGGVNTIGTMRHFKGASAPAVDATLGRWFSPQFALRAGWHGYEFAGRGLDPGRSIQTRPDGELYVERFGFTYIHGDVLWNWLPYDGTSVARWHFGPYVHMGFLSAWGLSRGEHISRHYAGGPGLLLDYQLLRRVLLEVDLRGFVLQVGTAGDVGDGGYVMAGSALVGTSVSLGRPDWKRWNPKPPKPPKARRPLPPVPPFLQGDLWDNWSVELSLGAIGNSPAAELSFVKWMTPSVGLRTGVQGLSLSDRDWTAGLAYLHEDLLISVADLLAGYDPARRWKLAPYLHFGLISEYNPVTVPYTLKGLEYAAGAGVSYRYRLWPRVSLTTDLRGTFLTSSASPVPGGGPIRVVPSIQAGLAYSLGREEGWRPLSEAGPDGEDLRLSRWSDGWFITGALGVNGFAGFGEMRDSRAALAADLGLGKWLSPHFGLRGGIQGLRLGRMANQGRAGAYLYEENGRYRERLGFQYLHGDFLWDLSSTFGTRKDRLFRPLSLSAYAHMGGFVEFGVSHSARAIFERELVAGAGLLTELKVDRHVSLALDLRATILRGEAMGESPAPPGGMIPSAMLGLTTRLGHQGFESVRGAGETVSRIPERARWALSANLLDAALLGTAGLSIQYGWTRHWSVEMTLRSNPFSYGGALYDRRQSIALGARWWPWNVYAGWFVRGAAQVASVSRKGLPLLNDGASESYGAGLSAGYALMLGRSLNLEFGAGLWAGRERPLTVNGTHPSPTSWFLAPDALSLSLVFVF